MNRFLYALIIYLLIVICGCTGMAASAQEYYSIGMSYYELGKYDEAEKWLNRARSADKTMVASEYNLGRIAYEAKRYEDAAGYFESVLKKDPNNILALKAAAYTRIKTGDIDIAEKHYGKLLELVPDSADDGFNHALVLYAMERYSEAEEVLEKHPFALQENSEVMLLFARIQNAQNKIEAIDNYAKWLDINSDRKVRYEYAQLLEKNDLFARALEEYRKALSEKTESAAEPKNRDIQFSLGRLLLVADSESAEGITEIEAAIKEGFDNIEAVEELQKNSKISVKNRDSLRTIVNNMQRAVEQKTAEQKEEENANLIPESDSESVPDSEANLEISP